MNPICSIFGLLPVNADLPFLCSVRLQRDLHKAARQNSPPSSRNLCVAVQQGAARTYSFGLSRPARLQASA